MTTETKQGKHFVIDEIDKEILRSLQRNSNEPLERIAKQVNLSKSSVWSRIQNLQEEGVILQYSARLDPEKLGLSETFFITLRTSDHNLNWLQNLQEIAAEMPEIMEAHRLAGHIDYLLKVQVGSRREFDAFYKRLVSQINLFDVTSSLSMEVLKHKTELPI